MSNDLCLIAATLRHNVSLASDVCLAKREFAALCGASVTSINTWQELPPQLTDGLPGAVVARLRGTVRETNTPVAFTAVIELPRLSSVARRAAFLQDVVACRLDGQRLQFDDPLLVAAGGLAWGPTLAALTECGSRFASCGDRSITQRLDALLHYFHTGQLGRYGSDVLAAVGAKKTTLALTHDLHIYKAKFFPRMVRSLLNIFPHDPAGWVLDPFSGSGTTLLESSLLGLKSIGLDVDPLSALISSCKVAPFTTQRDASRQLLRALVEAISRERLPLFTERVNSNRFHGLPEELADKLRRRDARDGTRFTAEIEGDLDHLHRLQKNVRRSSPGLLEVLVSDAVTKKIRYRFIGVGNGRYTIEVVKQRIVDRFNDKAQAALALCDVFEWLEKRCRVTFGETLAQRGDATTLSSVPKHLRVTTCITSPPYLPASSGREHYAGSRQLAFAATDLPDDWTAMDFVGSSEFGASKDLQTASLTPSGRALVEYLASDTDRADPQRDAMRFERKAVPTAKYLRDIERFFSALGRRIEPGGLCLMVVAAQHVFYSHRVKEDAKRAGREESGIEHVASGTDIYGEIASRSGWNQLEEIRLELLKSATSMARPRSSDAYHESVLVFRRSG
jgi:hypothetical protein